MIRSMAFWSDWSWKVRVVALALVAGLVVLVFYQREPRYEGMALSEWLTAGMNGDSDGDVTYAQHTVSKALVAMSPQALPILVDWLETRDSKIGSVLTEFLQKQSLVEIGFGKHVSRHELAAYGFALLGTNAAPAIPRLASLIEDPELSGSAFSALRSIGMAASEELLTALTNSQPNIRASAMVCLASWPFVHDPAILSALLRTLEDSDATVASHTVQVLVRMKVHADIVHPAILKLAAQTNYLARSTAIRAFSQSRAEIPHALPLYLDAMNDPDPTTRRAAVNGMRKTQSDEVMARLLVALGDSDPAVRARAVGGLGAYGEHFRTIVPELIGKLTNDLPIVQIAAVSALAGFGTNALAAVPHLVKLYRVRDASSLNDSAARALLAIDTNTSRKVGIDPSWPIFQQGRGRGPAVPWKASTN
jgi:HEAT repeat protein